MRLKKILNEILSKSLESLSAEEFADLYAKAWYKNWLRERKRLGDKYPEVNGIDYLFGQIEKSTSGIPVQKGHIGFLYDCIRNNRLTTQIASGQKGFDNSNGSGRDPDVEFRGEKCASFQGGCYYNALDFILRTDRKDAELAYGLMVSDKFLESVSSSVQKPLDAKSSRLDIGLTPHSFVLIGGEKVFDPSFPHSELTDETYAYQTVSESVYSKFAHDFEDRNYDASDFHGYVEKQLKSFYGEINLKERIRKIHEKA